MLELRELSLADEKEFCSFEHRYKSECKTEAIPFVLNPNNLEFKDFYQLIEDCATRKNLPAGFVLAKAYLIRVDYQIVGVMSLRMENNDFILNYAGHIGYGIAPWERNKGYAKQALKKLLILAKDLGMSNFLLTTDLNNYASQKVIISCGGVFEKTSGNKKFYWIHLPDWKFEESAMAIVLCKNRILSTKEIVYGNEVLSCPKGHVEQGETYVDTAIRECFEETGVLLTKEECVFEGKPFVVKFLDHHFTPVIKSIVPVYFKLQEYKMPHLSEERIIAIDYLEIDDFLSACSYDNVKNLIVKLRR